MNNKMKLILGVFLLLTQIAFGQVFNHPKCKSQEDVNLKIVRINRGDYFTIIDIEYVRKEC